MEILDYIACTKCDDVRMLSGAGNGKCSRCHGSGKTRKIGMPKYRKKCNRCGGSGKCPDCKGYGIRL